MGRGESVANVGNEGNASVAREVIVSVIVSVGRDVAVTKEGNEGNVTTGGNEGNVTTGGKGGNARGEKEEGEWRH